MASANNNNNKTEKEKMLAGELYHAFTPELTAEHIHAKTLCFELNQTSPANQTKRREIIQKLLGSTDAVVESPFNDYGYNIKVSQNFQANHDCTILDGNTVTIGDNVLLGPAMVISAVTHPLSAKLRAAGEEFTEPISIGDNAWIGANATILPGVQIGNNVVVSAGAVVTKDMPDNVVCAGCPARIICQLDNTGDPFHFSSSTLTAGEPL